MIPRCACGQPAREQLPQRLCGSCAEDYYRALVKEGTRWPRLLPPVVLPAKLCGPSPAGRRP